MSAGITEKTLYNWINKGKEAIECDEEDNPYRDFVVQLWKVEAEKVMRCLDVISGESPQWKAHMAILERRWRKFFGQDAGIIHEMGEKLKDLEEIIKRLQASHANPV